ncbi:zf-HC2 domain-containing protein [Dactylosporangium sp. NPDC048998]|uniref:zf-HC2 domain-containing protein n=1 Tax=Dactylosporangium sp. NPDC048998 TaxID=3363976 RepID=UPI00371685AE
MSGGDVNRKSWHCDRALLRRYLDGDIDLVPSASVEAHLMACQSCRATLGELSDPAALRRAWDGVRAQIQRPVLSPPLRALRRLGLTERDAVLLNASQSLRGPWALASAAVFVFVVAAAWSSSELSTACYLLGAPLVPLLGVVGAFATGDSLAALANTTPYSKLRLSLLRTVAVMVTTVPFVVGFGAIVTGMGWLSVAWLGPGLGLTLTALALLTWWPPKVVGALLSAAWIAVIAVAYGRHDVVLSVRPQAQLAYVALTCVTAIALAIRIRLARTPGGYA